ncbi:hypothetical protein [Flavobacterium psychrotolerans]|uniref:Uncharacterized protein n=1 Tax=Flavobacterium psychrotolerans TaxID=2169410 RepID=A0A2U1JKJ9_9FLAO|nr:hypothetical protein [Flavobacterium psychrotolerans]PWA05413.1 hypothetical protein DB895_07400 [Flavobacterium psychrotolerans]
MKKISLKDVKNGLKRDEMRMISGGCDYSSGTKWCTMDSECGHCEVCSPTIGGAKSCHHITGCI